MVAFGADRNVAPWFAQLRPAPPSFVRCADPTRPLCVRVLDPTGSVTIFHYMLFNYRTSSDIMLFYIIYYVFHISHIKLYYVIVCYVILHYISSA